MENMNSFHHDLKDTILLRKFSIGNHEHFERTARLNSRFLEVKDTKDFFTTQRSNNSKYVIKPLSNGGFVYGSNNENLAMVLLSDKGRFISNELINYSNNDFVDIMDIDVNSYNNQLLINERFNMYIYDIEKLSVARELIFRDNFVPITTKFNTFKHDVIASASKEQLVIFDNRLKYSVDGGDILYSTKDIKRKFQKQPFFKPSDLLWITENQLVISTRLSALLQIYDLRYSKDSISVKHTNDISSTSTGIQQLKIDFGSQLIYGLDTKNFVNIYDLNLHCWNRFQIEKLGSAIVKLDIFETNRYSSLISFSNSGNKLYIKATNLPRACFSELNAQYTVHTLKILDNSTDLLTFSINCNWLSCIQSYNDVSMLKFFNINCKSQSILS